MKWVEVILPVPFNMSFTYSVPEKMEDECVFGRRVVVPFAKGEKTGFVVKETDSIGDTDYEIKPVRRVIDKTAVFTRDNLETAEWMNEMYLSPVGVNLSSMIPSGRRESEYSPFNTISTFSRVEHLTDEQTAALEKLRSGGKGIYYIFGITGSGKSEVYLRRAEDIIAEGKQVLYLVPEITLTHQLSGEVYSRFGGRVAVLHSALTPSQRLKEWLRIENGEVDIVIGARSSVFAPFSNLGLIIIDEEHEGAYKSGSTPRYHARQVAQYRAQKCGAELIMGSATPSLEAWRLMREQKLTAVVMRSRIGEGKFPRVNVVNMTGETRFISPVLESEIRKALDNRKGVILFLNRRGFSYGYVCSSCGHVIECPNCSVSLTYHKTGRRLVCHTCGYSTGLLKTCPECRSRDLMPSGFGTEMAEEEVRQLFPSKRIERLDTDSVNGDKEKVRAVLEDFREGKIDILLGTQMIAKGLNFPLVSLVGVLNADSSLALPDFRAGERTFDLLYQVAGRAGRYRDDGLVIIQTRQSSAPAISKVALNKVEEFYDAELSERRETGFPPYSRLVNLTIRSRSEEKAKEGAEKLEKLAVSLSSGFEDIEIFSASPCLIEKMANQWRYHVLLRCTRIGELLVFTRKLTSEYKIPYSVHLEIDVDPQSVL